jgi:[calcium/calmodulin-dependent protein kinase] kinase
MTGNAGGKERRPLHLQPPTGINILPPSPIDPTHSPFRESTLSSPLAADTLSASPNNDPALLLPKESMLTNEGAPLRRVPSPSSPNYRPQRTHHRRTSSTHQVRETVDGSQTTTEDGRLVNQYKIGRSLGQGAYAKVELGVDVTTGKEYVSLA